MYSDLSLMYSSYLKYMINFKTKSDILNIRMTEVNAKAKNLHTSDLLFCYENFDAMIQ